MGVDLYSLDGGLSPQQVHKGWPGGGVVCAPSGGSVRVNSGGFAHFEAGGSRSYTKLFEYVDSVAPGVRLANPGTGDDGGPDYSKVSADGAAQLAAALTNEIASRRVEAHYAAESPDERSAKAYVGKATELRDFLLVSASDGGYEAF